MVQTMAVIKEHYKKPLPRLCDTYRRSVKKRRLIRKSNPIRRVRRDEVIGGMSAEEVWAVESIKDIFDGAFCKKINELNFSNMALVQKLSPAITDTNIISKINPDSKVKDRRHVSLKILAAMHYSFGISIDRVLDEAAGRRIK